MIGKICYWVCACSIHILFTIKEFWSLRLSAVQIATANRMRCHKSRKSLRWQLIQHTTNKVRMAQFLQTSQCLSLRVNTNAAYQAEALVLLTILKTSYQEQAVRRISGRNSLSVSRFKSNYGLVYDYNHLTPRMLTITMFIFRPNSFNCNCI